MYLSGEGEEKPHRVTPGLSNDWEGDRVKGAKKISAGQHMIGNVYCRIYSGSAPSQEDRLQENEPSDNKQTIKHVRSLGARRLYDEY